MKSTSTKIHVLLFGIICIVLCSTLTTARMGDYHTSDNTHEMIVGARLAPTQLSIPQLSWRFTNSYLLHQPTVNLLQFDVELKCSEPGTYHEELDLEFGYNTLAFGQQIVYNNKITLTKLELLQGDVFGIPKYSINGVVDGTFNEFQFSTQAALPIPDPSFMNEVSTQYTGFVRIQIEINDSSQYAGILLQDGFGFYLSTTNTSSTPYAYPSLVNNTLLYEPLNGLKAGINVFLEGPFMGSSMTTHLNTQGFLPLNQPYGALPWLYNGTENITSIPSSDIVDWVLVELRDAPTAAAATSATIVARQAAFVLTNGSVVGLDGISLLHFPVTISQNLFTVVVHRNHLAVLSAQPFLPNIGTNVYEYDFTTSENQTYMGLLGVKELGTGIWGMRAGDGDANGWVNNMDKIDVWVPQAGTSGYRAADYDLNGQVNQNDKIDMWAYNAGKSSQVPQ